MTRHALAVVLALAACQQDETLRAYGAAGKVWHLTELDGAAVTYAATLQVPDPGRISGTTPCNSYSGALTVPYPWFRATDLVITRRACAAQTQRPAFFAALSAMTLSEVLGDTLILSTEDGRRMVFTTDG